VKGRLLISCPTCGGSTYLPICAKCRDARPAPRPCDMCGQEFQPLNYRHVSCSAPCQAELKRRRDKANRDERNESKAQVKRIKAAKLPCHSCEHGRISRASDTGVTCSIEAAMRCRPFGPATLYLSWEAQANG